MNTHNDSSTMVESVRETGRTSIIIHSHSKARKMEKRFRYQIVSPLTQTNLQTLFSSHQKPQSLEVFP